MIEEFGRAIFAQLDFRIEARNNRRFRENFRGNPDVVFPEVIEALSTSRILCMTFIDGTKILAVDRTWSDPKRMARIGLETLLKMIFEDGFVHADLHPGNIFITPDDKLALLDLGLVGELDAAAPPGLRPLLRRLGPARRRHHGPADVLAVLGRPRRRAKAFERFRAAIIEFVGRYWGQRLGEVQVGKVLFDMLGILRRHRIRMNPAFTIVNIAIAVTEGIGKQLDPELDLMTAALPYFLAHPVDAEASWSSFFRHRRALGADTVTLSWSARLTELVGHHLPIRKGPHTWPSPCRLCRGPKTRSLRRSAARPSIFTTASTTRLISTTSTSSSIWERRRRLLVPTRAPDASAAIPSAPQSAS